MEKSKKSFYLIIENKRCGKFSGASPIQVAKKVASKKLKTGKKTEIIFYLDEVDGKKKRYGQYQGRKDKKTGQVVVINGGKVMKGGLLSANDIRKLRDFFYLYNDSLLFLNFKKNENVSYFVKLKLPLIPFFNEPIIFFDPSVPTTYTKKYYYKYAVFKESNGCIYIIIYNTNPNLFKIISFTEFFLNPLYSINNNNRRRNLLEKIRKEINSRTILDEAKKIYDFLYPVSVPLLSQQKSEKVIIYVPDYSHPLIRKCVYSNLTFGILNQENTGIIPSTSFIQKPTSNFQRFLIMKQSLVGGLSEPVIYVRVPQPEQPQSQNPFFTHCIYTESRTTSNLKIATLNSEYVTFTYDFNSDLYLQIDPYVCNILLQIPIEMGELKRVRLVADSILKLKHQSNNLPSRLNSVLTKFPQNQTQLNQGKLQELINEIKELIELLRQLEPQQPQSKLNNGLRKFNQGVKLKQQLNNLQIQLQQLQTSQFNQKSQPLNLQQSLNLQQPLNLQQQLDQLQKVLTEKLRQQQQQQQQPKLTRQQLKNIERSIQSFKGILNKGILNNITTPQKFPKSNL